MRSIAVIAAALVAAWALAVRGLAAPASPRPAMVPPPAPSALATDPAPAGVSGMSVRAGLAYGTDPSQKLDLYLPGGSRGARLPVIVFLHSGGWVAGSRANVPPLLLSQVGRADVALASVDYRLASRDLDGSVDNAFPAAPEDVDRAIRWIKATAPTLGLDPDRVILAGESAGGHLAALAAAAPGVFRAPDLPALLAAQPPGVAGVIDFVGPSDLETFPLAGGYAAGLETLFLGCAADQPQTCDPASVRAASVATHLGPQAPPAFLAYGRLDTLVVAQTQGLPLADAWAEARHSGAAVWYEDADDGHNLSAATINMAALDQWLDAVLAGAWH